MKEIKLTRLEGYELENTLCAVLDILTSDELNESEKILDLYDLRFALSNSHSIIKGANLIVEREVMNG